MRATAVIAVLLSMATCTFAAENEPKDLEELEQAKQAYEAAVEKARDKFTENIEKQIATFAKSGKLNVVTELQQDRDRFKSNSVLPESTYLKAYRTTYERELKTAVTTVTRAYDRAIITLTKRLETDQAQALKAELDALVARQTVAAKAVTVKASVDWQPTEIQVTEGHFYRIQAKGKWKSADGVPCGPNGMLSKPYWEAMHETIHVKGNEKYLTTQPINSLIVRIGEENWSFFAGTDCRFLAPRSGKLSFAMNDLKDKSAARDGAVDVTVTEVKNQKWIDDNGQVRITGLIDTSDELVMTAEGIRWRHTGGYNRVGDFSGAFPTIINGVYWFPQWPSDRDSSLLKTSEFAPNPKRTIHDFKFVGSASGAESSIAKATNDEAVIVVKKGNQFGPGVVSVFWRYAKP